MEKRNWCISNQSFIGQNVRGRASAMNRARLQVFFSNGSSVTNANQSSGEFSLTKKLSWCVLKPSLFKQGVNFGSQPRRLFEFL